MLEAHLLICGFGFATACQGKCLSAANERLNCTAQQTKASICIFRSQQSQGTMIPGPVAVICFHLLSSNFIRKQEGVRQGLYLKVRHSLVEICALAILLQPR